MQETPTSSDKVHFEDLEIGRVTQFGRISVTKDDIVTFARAYDPQPMHLDEEAARASFVGQLCASGFHSCAIFMRMLADGLLKERWATLGAPGLEESKWLKPLLPDQELTGRVVCTDKRLLGSRPEAGIATLAYEMLNQAGDVIMVWNGTMFFKVRHPGPKVSSTGERRPKLESVFDAVGPAPDPTRNFYEDRQVGEIYDLGSQTFTKDDIVAFARHFDPQPFHLDEEAGRNSFLGGLCASGWHTAAIWIRQFVAYRQRIEQNIRESGNPVARYGPSPGFRNLMWLKPVFPGDTITFRGRTAAKIDLKSRPDRGLLQTDSQGMNQRGELVFNIRGQILAERREPYKPQ